MRVIYRVLSSIVALTLVLALSGLSSYAQDDNSKIPHVTIACGISQVPYSVYSMPINQTETFTLTFNASGDGLITFVVNNYTTSYWARTDGSCGNCTLVVPNVQPGAIHTVQIGVTTAAAACPSGGLTVSNFVLQVNPSSASRSMSGH